MVHLDAATDARAADLRQQVRDLLQTMPRWGAKWKVYGRRVRRLERDWVVNGVNCPDVEAAVTEILKPY